MVADGNPMLLRVVVYMQQKLEEMRHRATQEQYYGKRGMSYHGTAVFISRRATSDACAVQHLVPDANTHPYQTYFFDDIVRNSQQQDTLAAMSLMEAAIMRVRAMFPEVTTISFQSDNGAAYASPFLLFMIPRLTAKHGLRATEFIHSEAGDGKTVLDGHFGIQTFMMKVGVRAGCGFRACMCLSVCVALACVMNGWWRRCYLTPSATPWLHWLTSTRHGWWCWPGSWPGRR
jgi:hypothetical protein